jgi:hypothetical protein
VTGLDAVAQWLLGGGGDVLRFCLYLFVAWLLIGALPAMRRDASARLPGVRGAARERMRVHAARAREDGRGKPPEWWGWTAAWGAVAVTTAGYRAGRYVISSAWHGWGEHRRRVAALRALRAYPWHLRAVGAARWRIPWRRGPATPPDDGGSGPGPGGGGQPPEDPSPWSAGPPHETEPPQPTEPDRPSAPPQTEDPETGPSRPGEIPEPAHSGAPGNGVPNVVPLFPPGLSPAGHNRGDEEMADAEISNLEAAVRVVSQMQAEARKSLEDAQLEKSRAEQALKNAEQASQDLAAAGISGPVMEAFVRYHEAMEVAERAAASEVVAYEMAVQAADSARGALQAHQDAADRLRATQGAADKTSFYTG